MTDSVHRLSSRHLRNVRPIWVHEPLDRTKAFDLLVFLDGEFYRDQIGAQSITHDLQSRGEIANSLVVFVSHESMESRQLECPCHRPFADFVARELLHWIWKRYPAAEKARERVLAGLSYTGLAASYVSMVYPDRFTRVISQPGSYWWNRCSLVEQEARIQGAIPTAHHLDVGNRETEVDLQHSPEVRQEVSQIEGVRRFRDVLLARGASVKHVEFDGGHDFEAWKKVLPGALRWALPV